MKRSINIMAIAMAAIAITLFSCNRNSDEPVETNNLVGSEWVYERSMEHSNMEKLREWQYLRFVSNSEVEYTTGYDHSVEGGDTERAEASRRHNKQKKILKYSYNGNTLIIQVPETPKKKAYSMEYKVDEKNGIMNQIRVGDDAPSKPIQLRRK